MHVYCPVRTGIALQCWRLLVAAVARCRLVFTAMVNGVCGYCRTFLLRIQWGMVARMQIPPLLRGYLGWRLVLLCGHRCRFGQGRAAAKRTLDGDGEDTLANAVHGGLMPCTACRRGVAVAVMCYLIDGEARQQVRHERAP